MYIIIGGFYDSDNNRSHRPQSVLLIYNFVSMMNVYAHVSTHVRVCILL